MNKKIIASIVIFTIVFCAAFSACKKNDTVTETVPYVTDEDGNFVRSENGELIVIQTDENGENVTDENGVPVSNEFIFAEQLENNGVIETFSYQFKLPKGWKSTGEDGSFTDKSGKNTFSISIVRFFYDDYLEKTKNVVKELKDKKDEADFDVKWEDFDYSKAGTTAKKLTITYADSVQVLCIFENSGNTYKLTFNSTDVDGYEAQFEELTNSITYLGNLYYNDITEVPPKTEVETETSAETTAAASK